jgi:hypothetical protein
VLREPPCAPHRRRGSTRRRRPPLESGHEERVSGSRVAARPQQPAAFERDADLDERAPGAEACGFVEEIAGAVERAAQPLYARQLCEHLRPTRAVDLMFELLCKAAFADVEIAEIPQPS